MQGKRLRQDSRSFDKEQALAHRARGRFGACAESLGSLAGLAGLNSNVMSSLYPPNRSPSYLPYNHLTLFPPP